MILLVQLELEALDTTLLPGRQQVDPEDHEGAAGQTLAALEEVLARSAFRQEL